MRDAEARRARLQAGFHPPGPPAAAPPGLEPGPDETLDALCGAWRIFQLRRGHRYSADDLLVAWYAGETVRRAGLIVDRALDLGSGIGSVALMVAWQFPGAHLTTVEAQAQSRALAARSVAWNGVGDRYTLLAGDLREAAPATGDFDLVTGSPPYFDPAAGVVSDGPQKGPCRFELRGGVEDYCAAAARAVRPGGRVALVMASAGRARVVSGATAAGLAIEAWRPVVFKEGRPPMIDLFALRLESPGDRADPRCTMPGLEGTAEPPLVLRAADDTRTEAFRAVRRAMGYPPGAA
jgi:tRNA1Val (adenine37-N6)-methyltransferase